MNARPAADTILRVDHLTMRFGGLVAVDDLSFEAGRGEITALIGPNGAGKTTVFNCITGFYKPTEGRMALAHGSAAAFGGSTNSPRRPTSRGRAPTGRSICSSAWPTTTCRRSPRSRGPSRTSACSAA